MDRWQIYDYSHYGVKWEIWPTGEWAKYDDVVSEMDDLMDQIRYLADENASLRRSLDNV